MMDDNTSIMTENEDTNTDNDVMIKSEDTNINNDVMANDNTSVNTANSQPSTRTIGKPKPEKDPNALKIASFRTKEGVWAAFSTKAESDGVTATDILKAAMEQYTSGEWDPRIIAPVNTLARHTNSGLTRNDVIDIVNTAISTAISTEQVKSSVMTAVMTPSLTEDEIGVIVTTKLVAFRTQLDILEELNKKTKLELSYQRGDIEKVRTSIEPITQAITELEAYTRERFEELDARSIAIVTPTTDKDPNTKSWVKFFEMIGMDALKANEARLTVNSDTRNKQATEGILAAKEQGLGDWVVKLAGQSFVRVDN